MRDAVTFYRSFHEAIQEEENPEKRLQAYEAILNYALYGEEPEGLRGIAKAAFIVAKPVIDSSNTASDNGRRGGAPKGNQNARKKTTENNPKQPPLFLENNPGCFNKTNNDNDNENENINENIKEEEKTTRTPKEKKFTFGEYNHVKLTQKEYHRLRDDFGEDMRAAAIRRLDEYIDEKPSYKSQNHNLAIRRWVIKAVEEDQQKTTGAKQASTKFHNIDCKHNRSAKDYEDQEAELLRIGG